MNHELRAADRSWWMRAVLVAFHAGKGRGLSEICKLTSQSHHQVAGITKRLGITLERTPHSGGTVPVDWEAQLEGLDEADQLLVCKDILRGIYRPPHPALHGWVLSMGTASILWVLDNNRGRWFMRENLREVVWGPDQNEWPEHWSAGLSQRIAAIRKFLPPGLMLESDRFGYRLKGNGFIPWIDPGVPPQPETGE